MDPGEDQIPHQQDQHTHKSQPIGHNTPGLTRYLQGPFTVPHDCLAPAVGKCFHNGTGPTVTAVTKVAQGADQSLHQQYKLTLYCQTCGHHPPGLLTAPQEYFTAPLKRLAPAVGKGFHAETGPTGTDVPQEALGDDQIPRQQDQRTQNSLPFRHHPPDLPRTPQVPFPVPYERLTPAFGKVLHATPGPTGTEVP